MIAETARFIPTADAGAIAAIAGAYHSTPFDVLEMHPVTIDGSPGLAIRTFQPRATEVSVNRNGVFYPMERVHPDGSMMIAVPPLGVVYFKVEGQ